MGSQLAKRRWSIHFFRRVSTDDSSGSVPTIDFLDGLSPKIAAEIHAVLDAVAEAPPPAFAGGGSGRPCTGTWLASTKCGSREAA